MKDGFIRRLCRLTQINCTDIPSAPLVLTPVEPKHGRSPSTPLRYAQGERSCLISIICVNLRNLRTDVVSIV
jgi:hypothetical protein